MNMSGIFKMVFESDQSLICGPNFVVSDQLQFVQTQSGGSDHWCPLLTKCKQIYNGKDEERKHQNIENNLICAK